MAHEDYAHLNYDYEGSRVMIFMDSIGYFAEINGKRMPEHFQYEGEATDWAKEQVKRENKQVYLAKNEAFLREADLAEHNKAQYGREFKLGEKPNKDDVNKAREEYLKKNVGQGGYFSHRREHAINARKSRRR